MKKLFTVLSKIVPWFVIAYFWCEVDSSKVYTWYDGFWQGAYLVPNWIISFFQEDRLCKAVEFTTSYNILWWICAVISSVYFFMLAIGVILILFGKTKPQAQQ